MAMPRSFGSSQVTFLSADPDLSFGNIEQAGNGVQQSRFAAAGWTEQDDELPLLDIERKAVEHTNRRESDTHIAKGDRGHASSFHCAGGDAADEPTSRNEIDRQRDSAASMVAAMSTL